MASPGGYDDGDGDDPHLFAGIRFVLVGFDSVSESQYRSEMVRHGGADVGRFGKGCTHVIACGRVYDDPTCVAARAQGNKVVSELWVDDSLDRGVLADADRVIYWPIRDLNGIPGSESLHICLTGYQRNDREDIMKMVSLMGAQFSKPLLGNLVTHLICYKSEGEKYELAKRLNIKLVNHRWLEDCLKSWEILPVNDYSKSSWELEVMETQAKDLEDEAEDVDRKTFNGRSSVKCTPNPQNSTETSADPDVNAPIQSPIIPSGNREMAVERHLNTPGQIRKAEVNRTHDITAQGTPNTSRFAISANINVSAPIQTPFVLSGNRRDAAVRNLNSPNQIQEAECKYVGTRTLDITTGEPGPPSSSRMAVSDNQHRHSSNETLTIPSRCMDNVARKLLDNHGQIDVSISDLTTPSRENWSANVLDSSHVNIGQHQEDGATGNLVAVAGRSNFDDKLPNHKAMVENKCTPSHSAIVQDGKRNPGFSFQNKDEEVAQANNSGVDQYALLLMHETENARTKDRMPDMSLHSSRNSQLVSCYGNDDAEMTDALDVNKHEAAMASNFKLEKVVSDDNVKASLKGLPDTSSNVLCGTSCPKKLATPRARNAGAKRPCSASMEVDGSVFNNGKAVVSESEPDKMIPCQHAGATFKNVSISASATECKITSPKEVLIYGVRNTSAKRQRNVHTKVNDAQVASNLELSKVISQENNETEPKKFLSSANAGQHRRNSPKKLPNTRVKNTFVKRYRKSDANMTGESLVDKAETVAAESLFDDLFPSENVEDCPKTLSSSASADGCGTLPPKNISTARVRKVVAKRKIKAVEHKSGSKHDKIGSAIVSAAKAFSSKRMEESAFNIKNITADQDSHKGNKDGMRDASGLFCKDSVTVDKSVGLHNSKLRCSKRNKTPASDHDKENRQDHGNLSSKSNGGTGSLNSKFAAKSMQNSTDMLDDHGRIKGNGAGTLITLDPAWFILSGHRQQRKDYRSILRHLKGRVCRDSHHWSYQVTHFIAPNPLRRTEKFFAAAAAGRWILKSDYLTSCNDAGKFLNEDPFEWFGEGLNDGETISLEAPRKWRVLRQQMGHGAFYGMQIIVYGQLISPSLDTVKRAVRAGDGTILATSPPYTRFLNSGVDFAVVSASMPSADAWVQEFMSHNIPCVSADYLVEYVCKPGYPLDRHVLFKTNRLANKSLDKLLKNQHEVATDKTKPLEDGDPDDLSCSVCGRTDRGEVMLICGDEDGTAGCGAGMHIDCCDPPLEAVPDDDWLCPRCDVSKVKKKPARGTGSKSRGSKRR